MWWRKRGKLADIVEPSEVRVRGTLRATTPITLPIGGREVVAARVGVAVSRQVLVRKKNHPDEWVERFDERGYVVLANDVVIDTNDGPVHVSKDLADFRFGPARYPTAFSSAAPPTEEVLALVGVPSEAESPYVALEQAFTEGEPVEVSATVRRREDEPTGVATYRSHKRGAPSWEAVDRARIEDRTLEEAGLTHLRRSPIVTGGALFLVALWGFIWWWLR